MAKVKTPSRRRFLILAGVAGGALVVGYALRDRDRLAKKGAFGGDEKSLWPLLCVRG